MAALRLASFCALKKQMNSSISGSSLTSFSMLSISAISFPAFFVASLFDWRADCAFSRDDNETIDIKRLKAVVNVI
jgi:hypothetical protein